MKGKSCFKAVFILATLIALSISVLSAYAESFKFGVMSDTQWKGNLDGQNPGTSAIGIVNQLNSEFIRHGVQFVIQVGDLVDKESDVNGRTMPVRAAAAQTLYDAGIGFYPLRGNHEASKTAAEEFQALYPQTIGAGSNVYGASSFSSPFPTLQGLSYSFDYGNARFVMLDQFKRTDNTDYLGSSNNNIIDQLGWIESQLSGKAGDTHAFIFSHKNLIGQNHADGLFGSNPSSNSVAQNAFFASLQNAGVRYHFGGHDHMHNRSIIASPDNTATVQDIIASSNSYKFYIPQIPSNDAKYNFPAFGFLRETPIEQELFGIGYYIVTVDGPRVTVDHYASPNGCDGDCDLTITPLLAFNKRETFGYSLNGREFLVPQSESFAVVQDDFEGTVAQILDGTNGSTATDYAARPLTKSVNTGWTPKDEDMLASHRLTLWGMAELGNSSTDTFVLSMTYEDTRTHGNHQGNGGFRLAAKDSNGQWVKAAELISGRMKRKFIVGPWIPGYELGTYGVDPETKTAWAVLNFNGDFAVARFDQ